MHSINSLITRLQADYPELTFKPAADFKWSAANATVFYDTNAKAAKALCLHELSHAILKHRIYNRDVDLLKLERDAWDFAQQNLASRYNVIITDELAQENLDTYRDWLHARSTCPTCNATGIQSSQSDYRCLACGGIWKVNEARICALKRSKANDHS